MISNVSRLKPRLGSFENALDAYCAGEFSLCFDFLSENSAHEAAVLRARALFRLGQFSRALEALNSCPQDGLSQEAAAEFLVFKVCVLHAMHRGAEAAQIVFEARARCFSAGVVAIEGELLYALAIGALSEGDEQSAEAAAVAILELEDESPVWFKPGLYRFPLSFWRSRACDIRGVIEHARANHAGQASWFRRAFDEFDRAGIRDDFSESAFLANYADAAISIGTSDILDFVIERSKRITWTPALISHEFRVYSALAEACSAAGDQLGALRYFRRCMSCAPSSALKIRASVERARLLSEVGESFSSREELDYALRLSREVNWEIATSLEQRQLVFLAGQVAGYSAVEAVRLLERYDTLRSSIPTNLVMKDERFRGEEFAARAAVMRANGRSDRAVLLLLDALDVWTAAGYESKAASAAAELAELTNEPHYIAIARKQCEKQPNSILARKMERFEAREMRPPVSLKLVPVS